MRNMSTADHLISTDTKYGHTPHYVRPDGTYYVRMAGQAYDKNNPNDVRALRAHILDVWRPSDAQGESLYRQMAADPDYNVWER
jgi:hypothetical protein